MARPVKKGIDYFQADVDMFQDRKIKRLLRSAGSKGFTVYIYLLTCIYRDEGYLYEWDEHSAFDISDDLNFSESVVEESVKACCAIGLFNEILYTEKSILSSESIQNRWSKIVKDANRTDTKIDAEYCIKGGELVVNKGGNEVNSEETPKDSEETQGKDQLSTQSKVKESKVKESKQKYREDVRLKVSEYDKLCEEYDKPFIETCLDKLNNYKLSTGKKYKSDYRAILSWVIQAVQEDILKSNQNNNGTTNKRTKGDEHTEYLLS